MDQNFEPNPQADVGATPAQVGSFGAGTLSEKDERLWAMLCHLASLLGYSVIPFGHILGPLIVWQMKKNESPFVDDQGKEALNFQISMTLYLILAALTICVVVGVVLTPAVAIFGLVMTIIAGIKANQGVTYRYPLTIRLIK